MEIKDAIETHSEGKVDWMIVHNAGCTCDDTDLPHHVSDLEEIEQLMSKTRQLLASLTNQNPGLVTMSRSSLDEFCPPNQVEHIQEEALKVLTSLYPDVQVFYDYK
jgi:hypothetical protein